MPSEKRRQRQQRVRHEAGDYTPASSQTNDSPDSESTVKTPKPPEEPLKESAKQIPVPHENISAPQRNNDSNFRRVDQGRNDNRYKDRGKGGIARGQGRGRGASDDYRKRENTRGPRTANVVFAEEEREYEPVMIMESKKDAPSEAEKLPQTSEPSKYQRREVISNWLRYDELPPEEEAVDGEDYMLGEDFSSILNLNVTKGTGSFLHLKGEMSWGKIDNSDFNSYGLGALKIADLVRALGTIPLYDQLKIPEEVLPVFTASTYKDSARQNLKTYEPDQEYVTDIEMTNQSILDSLRLKESEPISLLNDEESKPVVDKADNVDATLKFSSAFQPEADDVDLDKFVADSVSQPSEVRDESATNEKTKATKEKKVKRKPEPQKSDPTPDKSSPPPEEPKAKPSPKPKETSPPQQQPERRISPKTTPQPTPEPKTGFDFGLSKAPTTAAQFSAKKTPDPPAKANKEKIKETKEDVEEEKIIDLDQPVANKSAPPVLVGKSEVENLEDWLDSVLDD